MWEDIQNCRVCKSENLKEVFSLGIQSVKDFLDSPSDIQRKGPLDLVLCEDCSTLQLKQTFSKEYLYTHYWYRSGTSPTMIKELANIVGNAKKFVELHSGDVVVDVGSNDGTLLKQYSEDNLVKIGFEPSNLWKYGVSKDTLIFNEYFNEESFTAKFPDKKARILTSIAMFYDLDDPNKFCKDVNKILATQGIWIVQMNHVGLMLKNLGYDNICHEHVCYYSLTTMQYLLKRNGLEVFDAELNNVNGGSFRIYIKHSDDRLRRINHKKIEIIKNMESKMKLSESSAYVTFAKKVRKQRSDLKLLISNLRKDNKKILIYGASTRGLVILEHCGIDSKTIKYATDKNSDKWGKYLSGTGIKVIPLDEYRNQKPDFLLILPYQYANEIAFQEKEYLENGGKFIIPLPTPKILDKDYLNSLENSTRYEFLGGYDNL